MEIIESQSLHALDWPVILSALTEHARCLEGQKRAGVLPLFERKDQAQACFQAVEELRNAEALGDEMPTGGLLNICVALEAAGKGRTLDLSTLSHCSDCLSALHRLEKWIENRANQAPGLVEMAANLAVDVSLKESLHDSFEEPGVLSQRHYPILRQLRQSILNIESRIESTLERLIKDPNIQALLQDNFVTTRGDRAVLPIRAGAKRMGLGIVHDTSSSGETVFIEPKEIVELNNQKREAEAALAREELRIRKELSQALGAQTPALKTSLEIGWDLDLVAARKGLAEILDGESPVIGEEGCIELEAARHPVLILGSGKVVANALRIDHNKPGLVLTGSNAGGKTVALKTLGLAALFVRAGIPFPAKRGLRIDFFQSILADIGDAQTLTDGLSTFSAHMLTLKHSLKIAGPQSLVLLDELAVGTDPMQGAALARVVLQDLVSSGARVVTTTHYAELKGLPAIDPRFQSAAVSFSHGRPTYMLRMGEIGLSHAFAIAAQMGLSDDLISRAKDALSEHERHWIAQSESLEQALADQRETQEALQKALFEAKTAKKNWTERNQKLRKEKTAILEDLTEKERIKHRIAEDKIKAIISSLQGNASIKEAGKALEALRVQRPENPPVVITTPGKPLQSVRKGQKVHIATLGKDGVVCTQSKKGIEVQVGALKLWVAIDTLSVAPLKEKTHQSKIGTSSSSHSEPIRSASLRTISNSVDLRGLRADEALRTVDFFLDRLLQHGDSVAYILHGHGTGALKKAVREWLRDNPVVASWRPASDSEGGDAFTRVDLR
jgi:DNA mismatch repair protein MutS2